MADPTVLDVRAGLTQEAIDLIRRASRLQLALADPGTAFLGLWTADDSDAALLVLLVEHAPRWSGRTGSMLIMDLPGPALGGAVERLAAALQSGDRLTVDLMMPERRAILAARGPENFEIRARLQARTSRRWQPTARPKLSEGNAD